MKTTKMLTILVLALGLMVWQAEVSEAAPMGTAFTYQGRLIDANEAADGLYDFQFKLFNDPCTGTQQGSTIDVNDLDVIDGYFTAELDFGSGIFDGNARWLETRVVESPLGSDPCTLRPRIEITPVPYALHTRWFLVDTSLDNVFAGEGAGASNTTGSGNSAMGYEALRSNTTGGSNSAMGLEALYSNTMGYSNSAVGRNALYSNTSGYGNSATGYHALYSNTMGGYNSAMGSYALYSNTTGFRNSAMGYRALYFNTTGNYNSAMGMDALRFNTTGFRNSVMGLQANYYNREGSRNTIVGYEAGRGTSAHNKSGNVFVGYQAGYSETGDDKLYIANSDTSTPLIYGDFATGNVGIGTTSPAAKLDVAGVIAANTNGADLAPGAGGTAAVFGASGSMVGGAYGDGAVSGLLYSASAGASALYGRADGGGTGLIVDQRGVGDIVRFQDWQADVFVIKDGGNVGIGTTSPTQKLDVAGNVTASRYYDRNNTGYYVDPAGTSYCNDMRANIFYDRGNITYYMDPANTGTSAKFAGNIQANGNVESFGNNGNLNARFSYLTGYPNNGYIAVKDAAGATQAGMYVDSSGNGRIYADSKSFRVANPGQPGTEIWYTCPEGPEAAAYVRGTGHLTNGKAEIILPDHFVAVASPQGITVQVTPLSAQSRGLAVVHKAPDRFVVQELAGGNGTYDFDYLVMAVRKGHEGYQVIRPALEAQAADAGEAAG